MGREASCHVMCTSSVWIVLVLFAIFALAFGRGVHPHLSSGLFDGASTLDLLQQNVTSHVGNIVVENNSVFLIRDCLFNQTGKLVVRDRAEAIVSNATFILNWNPNETLDRPFWVDNVILQDQGKLTVVNSVLILSSNMSYPGAYHYVALGDKATANVTDSEVLYSEGKGDYFLCQNSSRIWMRNVTISTFHPQQNTYNDFPKSGLGLSDVSEADVQNSDLDYVYVGATQGNCTVHINASWLETLEVFYGNDMSRIELSNCNASLLNIQGRDSDVRLTNSTVAALNKNPSARVVLFNSSVRIFYAYGYSNVWVIWTFPLFGQVEIPYAWAPYVVPIAVASVAIVFVITSLTLFLIARRKRKRKLTTMKASPSSENKAQN